MASLPDLDTSNVGFIAYYNVIDDGGASSIDPEDMLTDGNINSYTLYDNGFTADYNNPVNPLPVTVRAKSDGWITAHTSREENYSFGDSLDNSFSDVQGWYNFATGTEVFTTFNEDLTQNALERSIQSLQANLSNSDTYTYNTADVNLYNYEYTNATNVTIASVNAFGNDVTDSGGISATSTTTLDAAVAYAKLKRVDVANIAFAGTTIATASGGGTYAAADLIANGLFGATGTEKTISVTHGDGLADSTSLIAIVVWH